jgi:hypothetical protein
MLGNKSSCPAPSRVASAGRPPHSGILYDIKQPANQFTPAIGFASRDAIRAEPERVRPSLHIPSWRFF